jgi:hypothetical protein
MPGNSRAATRVVGRRERIDRRVPNPAVDPVWRGRNPFGRNRARERVDLMPPPPLKEPFMSWIRTASAALVATSLLAASPASAGDDPRNYFALPDAIEVDGVRIEFREVWAEEGYVKGKAKITNETADYIFFHKHEATFDGDFGTLQAHDGKKKKPVIIHPKKSKNHTWKIDGESGFLV